MSDPYRREVLETWVSDFCDASAFRDHPSLVREYAPEVLVAFLEAACAHRDVAPGEIEEADLKVGLLAGVTRVELPGSVREDVPALCAAFLEEMQAQGRLADGRTLGLYVKALKGPYVDAAAGRTEPIRAPAAKVGRNDPCPCGSGRKYKKCCQGLLGP